ncbi:MAG: sigma-70 family RNA polymerase sigma factor [Planctomycetota bacterium]|nr:sigma-70 family RNA polymerase sigma factor [Planctomycetota bacterium]
MTTVPDPAPLARGEPDVAAAVAAVLSGDREAFGLLHGLFARMVHAILLARVPAREADDLTQDVFLTALRKLDQLKNRAAFGPWVAQIARNRAYDHHRRSRRFDTLPAELAGRGGADALEAREALAAIRALPAAYRETLMMRLVEGMTGPEIAARMSMTPGSVRVNLHRGMRLLRDALGQKETR